MKTSLYSDGHKNDGTNHDNDGHKVDNNNNSVAFVTQELKLCLWPSLSWSVAVVTVAIIGYCEAVTVCDSVAVIVTEPHEDASTTDKYPGAFLGKNTISSIQRISYRLTEIPTHHDRCPSVLRQSSRP